MRTYRRTWAKWRERNADVGTWVYDETVRRPRGGTLVDLPRLVGVDGCVTFEFTPDTSRIDAWLRESRERTEVLAQEWARAMRYLT